MSGLGRFCEKLIRVEVYNFDMPDLEEVEKRIPKKKRFPADLNDHRGGLNAMATLSCRKKTLYFTEKMWGLFPEEVILGRNSKSIR